MHHWLKLPHAAEWFYGEGLQNTLNGIDRFVAGSQEAQYWIGYDKEHPFAFLITSRVEKPVDTLSKWCAEKGEAITLDLLIGDTDYIGKGLSGKVIRDFLLTEFPTVDQVLIDPELTNTRAIHVYKKAGFVPLAEFIPTHSPHPHLMMRLEMEKLRM